MKVFEIAGPVFSGPSGDFAPTTPDKELANMAPEEELTSAEDVVLSKNGDQAVRDLKLSDQEIELLKAVALGWADPSDLGDLEQDIFDYWLESNPEDFNPDLHGGGADPSDTIMDELESWFEDKGAVEETYPGWGPYPGYGMPKTHPKHPSRKKKNESEVKEWSKGNKKAAEKAPDYKGSTDDHGFGRKKIKDDVDVDPRSRHLSTRPGAQWPGQVPEMPSHNEMPSDEEIIRTLDGTGIPHGTVEPEISDEEIQRILKLAGVEESHTLNLGPKHPNASTAAKGPGVRGFGYNDKYQWSGATDLTNLDPDTQAIDAMDYSDSYDAGKAGNVDVSITPAGSRAFDKAMRKRGKWVDPAIDDRNKG